MPNPKLETYKNKATGTVYDYTDAAAQAALAGILDGTDIDSFEDVETALATKVDKVTGKGLSTNDYDDTEKAKVAGAFPRSEQAVLGARNFDPINNLKTVTTQEGVKYTPVHDSDGSLQYVIINRESAGTQQAYPDFTLNLRLKAGRYKLSCPMEGGEWGLDKMRYYIRYGSTYVTKDSDADPIFTLTEDTTINFTSVRVEAGYSPSNVKVYPMILLADDSYTGYSPYAMTNKELTEMVRAVPIEDVYMLNSGFSFLPSSCAYRIGNAMHIKLHILSETAFTKWQSTQIGYFKTAYATKNRIISPCYFGGNEYGISAAVGYFYTGTNQVSEVRLQAEENDRTAVLVETSYLLS